MSQPGFKAYIDYVFIKRHFLDEKFMWDEAGSYGKIKPTSFQKRNDAAFFVRLEKDCQKDRRRVVDRLVSCAIYNNNFWIGETFLQDYVDYHNNRMKRYGALESTFQNESEWLEFYLIDKGISLADALLTSGVNDPIIIKQFGQKLSLETFAVLEHLTGFTRSWFPINPLFKMRRLIVYKYSKLLRLNERSMEKIIKTYHNLSIILAPSAPIHLKGETV